jgi:hypothetical protein
LSVVSVENSPFTAVSKCLRFLKRLDFSLGHYRRDIGHFVLSENKYVDYSQSGVNIDEGNRLVEEIKADCGKTLLKGTEKVRDVKKLLGLCLFYKILGR